MMQKLAYKIGNRFAVKCEYLLITYKLTEFILMIEAKYSAVVESLILTSLILKRLHFYVLSYFSYSITVSDSSMETTAGCVV